MLHQPRGNRLCKQQEFQEACMQTYQDTAEKFGLSHRPKNHVNNPGHNSPRDSLEYENRKDGI